MGQTCTLAIENELSEIHRMTDYIEHLGGTWKIPQKAVNHITLALEELVANIINYGFDDGDHVITLTFSFNNEMLIITIIDDGRAFNPLDAPEPDITASAEERKIGGLGIHFAKTLMDSVTYKRVNDSNNLTLTKRIERPES